MNRCLTLSLDLLDKLIYYLVLFVKLPITKILSL